MLNLFSYRGETYGMSGFSHDLLASVVVFLVALPLCMGIAIASGVPPALGLITGIVGGLMVGAIAGSPFQVSGPAAGLAIIVLELVRDHGIAMLGVVVLTAGIIQLSAGLAKLGQWFRAVSPSVIQGMLAGIGVLIFASQFHVMVDDKPPKAAEGDLIQGGLLHLLTIPEAIFKAMVPIEGTAHHLAALIGLLTIGSLVAWNLLRPKKLNFVPAPLVAVIFGTAVAQIMGFQIDFVEVPARLTDAISFPTAASLSAMLNVQMIGIALSLALVASAETLLCATAVDQLHDGPRTRYDQELAAQGLGNIICGILGALPMTGVIVRSSANVEAGARSRLSAILHGLWLLMLVAALPFVLELIPVASLAAILVYTGYKLLNPKNIAKLWRFNRTETAIFAVTLFCIVAFNLLYGVLIGLALAMARLLYNFSHVVVTTDYDEATMRADMSIEGAATFLGLPRVALALDEVPAGYEVHVHLRHMSYIDHACIELFNQWEKSRASQNNSLIIEWDELYERFRVGPRKPNMPPATVSGRHNEIKGVARNDDEDDLHDAVA